MIYKKIECDKCNKLIGSNNFKKHYTSCEGIKECPVCSSEFVGTTTVCSLACSNTLYRSRENNPNWKGEHRPYRAICFDHHEKKCVVCGEANIVAVHHMNEDHEDNRPENLIPLCPTHHVYVHSRFSSEVLPLIDKYLSNWKNTRGIAQPG